MILRANRLRSDFPLEDFTEWFNEEQEQMMRDPLMGAQKNTVELASEGLFARLYIKAQRKRTHLSLPIQIFNPLNAD